MLENRKHDLYEVFKGLPSNKQIVRKGQENDAFVLVVAEILFKELLGFSVTKENLSQLSKIIVPPPDDGIDIFLEQEDVDENIYHIVQVKYSELSEHEINDCFAVMKRTIAGYLDNPKKININLKEIIQETNFDIQSAKNKCMYYVVHKGDLNNIKNMEENERIITMEDLEVISKSIPDNCVPFENIDADVFNNFICYNRGAVNDPKAYLCNLNGFGLAKLNNKYSSTEVGRNILFGNNLRDALNNKKSKTYQAMCDTISNEPEKFWYYNNGITIIAREFTTELKDIKKLKGGVIPEVVILKGFSIINGAQTTSTLGSYLKAAEVNKDQEKIDNLKKVYVLARIVEVGENKDFKTDIAIYNNSQNPITNRDMVSNREEQKELQKKLLEGNIKVFVEIRRGETLPSWISIYKHQFVTNEVLAQLSFASFLGSPYQSKDKKNTLFNSESQNQWNRNYYYHKVFNYTPNNPLDNGILFKKTVEEIDELLFIYQLHKETKKYMKQKYTERIERSKSKLEIIHDDEEKVKINNHIQLNQRLIEIGNICLFYNIALFYELKEQFEIGDNKHYNYNEFYSKKYDYRQRIIKAFFETFYEKTIEILKHKSGEISSNNWIRNAKNEKIFLDTLREEITLKSEYENRYTDFINKFKIS